jgi:hypothetical protein
MLSLLVIKTGAGVAVKIACNPLKKFNISP